MNPGDHELFGTTTPLVYCPECQERLVYEVDASPGAQDVALARHCPGCAYRDSVVSPSLSVAVWYRRETRILAELRPLAVFLVEAETRDNALVGEQPREAG
jgi:hypothetical protein